MSLTIIVSGPAVHSSQAQTALQNAGCRVISTEATHGLRATRDGSEPTEPQQILTAIGELHEHVDAAHQAIEEHGWGLRMHFHTPPPPEPTPQMMMADLQAQIDELKGRLP